MKKILVVLLALIVVLANVAAFAEETEPAYTAAPGFEFEPIPKNYYKAEGSEDPAVLYPAETITFTVAEADENNPDGGANNVTVTALSVTGVSGNKIKVTVPDLPEPGLYHFSIKENEGKTQGVSYTGKDTELKISVLVAFDLENDPEGKTLYVEDKGVTATGTDEETGKKIKVEEIANVYEVADLTITKAVSGNLGNKKKYFPVDVTFKTEEGKTVLSKITIEGETSETKVSEIASGWTGEKKVTINVKDTDSIVFKNVPLNVTYKVEETAATTHVANASDEPNNPDAYKVGGEVTTATAFTAAATVSLTNEKGVEIDTGVSVETLPYIMILAIVMIGVALLLRKREEN